MIAESKYALNYCMLTCFWAALLSRLQLLILAVQQVHLLRLLLYLICPPLQVLTTVLELVSARYRIT